MTPTLDKTDVLALFVFLEAGGLPTPMAFGKPETFALAVRLYAEILGPIGPVDTMRAARAYLASKHAEDRFWPTPGALLARVAAPPRLRLIDRLLDEPIPLRRP